ncbi:MAG: fumarylacetoacetate hydrolase family protein [Saprospiraceae bacterium]|nr:fumarylacetoacetate hydrolase family protein [Saprospiraceae bacterium]
MKLVRFGEAGNEKPGVLIDNERKDCSAYFKDWNRDFFNNNGLFQLKQILEKQTDFLPVVDEDVRWSAPIARPGMIMCIGLNYSDHAKESGMPVPSEPILFMKPTNTIRGAYDTVAIPKASLKSDWEVELGIVLNKDCLYLENEQAAWDAIAGYCVVNDLSERAFQLERGGQWVKGKAAPGFTPVGPYLATADEIPDVMNLKMQLWKNGVQMQNGNTSTMVFGPGHLVHYISQFMQMEAGDLITTGTPPGVALGMKVPEYLREGDIVELEIDGLGSQKQIFKSYNASTNV